MKVSALPAKRGDSLLLEFGDGAHRGRILIDCGFKSSYTDSVRTRLATLEGDRKLDLLVVTHVDLDHINGVLEMFNDDTRPVTFDDVWFNSFEHLQGKRLVQDTFEGFGGPEGEELSAALIASNQPWNKAFDGHPVTTTSAMTPIRDGLTIKVLSPSAARLTALIPKWEQECMNAGIKPGVDATEPSGSPFEAFGTLTVDEVRHHAETPFTAEGSESNGSTIAVLVEHEGQRALLTGDASAEQLIEAIRPLADAAGGRLPLDLMQVPHHGSRGNLSKELLELVDSRRYLVSTNGANHAHPHAESIARILVFGGDHGKELIFNYSQRGVPWLSSSLQEEFQYTVTMPSPSDDGAVTVDLSPT
jgi:beta-lactamase superfamily II metal-dependent hydrolase